MPTVQDAIDHLYGVAVEAGKSTSTLRLKVLADYCVQELAARGIRGVQTETEIPGAGRAKQWDVAWEYDGKYRLGISLKSLLKNIPGTVPNRIDDLMGEVANAQLHSPEIVVGYILIFDVGKDAYSAKHGSTWLQLMRSRLQKLSGRHAPAWTAGTIEAHVIAEVDFAKSSALMSSPDAFAKFFDTLVEEVVQRNPNALAGG